jgi:hypothetical protein
MVPSGEAPANVREQGTRIHTAMQGWYGYQLDPLSVLHVLYGLAMEEHPDWEADLRKEQDVSLAMVEGYLEWAAAEGIDADLEVVATEADIEVPLEGLDGVILRAQLDQVVFRPSRGLLGFLDFKTGDLKKHEYLELDPQFKTYSLIQRLAAGHGIPWPGSELRADRPAVSGGVIRSLRRVKRTEKSKPPYYQNDEFWYTPEQLSAQYRRILGLCREIAAARAELDFRSQGDPERLTAWLQEFLPPTPVVHDCSWSCPFVTLCPMMDDGSDWAGALMRSGKYRQQDPYDYYRRDALHGVRAKLAAL